MRAYAPLVLGIAALAFGAGGCTPFSCEHGGKLYLDGASFPCGDGCNGCFCNNGTVAGTNMGCSAPCPQRTVPPDAPIRGIVPVEVASAFEGTHVAPVAWFASPDDAWTGTWEERGGIGIEDEITLAFSYHDGDVVDQCEAVALDVSVAFGTGASALSGSGTGRLRLAGGMANLWFETEGIEALSAAFTETSSGVVMTGDLRMPPPYEPGGFAQFPPRGPNCLAVHEPDGPGLDPTAQFVIDWLEAAEHASFPWVPAIEPMTIELTPDEPMFCDSIERAEIPVAATLTFSSGDQATAKGQLALLHEPGLSSITSIELSLSNRSTIDSRDVLPDEPPCTFGDVEIKITAVPSDGGLTVTSAIFAAIDDCSG